MTADELKALPKGEYIVMKTGTRPMRTRLRLFLDWGITLETPYESPERPVRKVAYAGGDELIQAIREKHGIQNLADQEHRPLRTRTGG